MTILSISAKGFWYASIENSVRLSKTYLENKTIVTDTIATEVTDVQNFDEFIANENIRNYNLYLANHCGSLTEKNFKIPLHSRIANWFRKKFGKRQKSTIFYLNKYIVKMERKAMRLHKLSAINILTLCNTSNVLVDDRNNATKRKWSYFITSTILSVAITFALAMIAFTSRTDIDTKATLMKMLMYSVTIISSILQTVFRAYMTVQYEDTAYFKKVMTIIDKYKSFKHSPVMVSKVSYLKEESNAKSNNNPSK
jgi:hypothetical protein